jgi:hypothetical protein
VESLAADVVTFLDAINLEVHYIGESLGGLTGVAPGALYPVFADDPADAD